MTGKTAIVLFNLGGPDNLEAVEPFLFNLFKRSRDYRDSQSNPVDAGKVHFVPAGAGRARDLQIDRWLFAAAGKHANTG